MNNTKDKKEKIITNLQLFNYKYIENKNQLRVKLDFNLDVIIHFRANKIEISNGLMPWNFLSGVIKTSLKKNLKAIHIGSLVVFLSIHIFELLSVELYLFTLAGILIFYFVMMITFIFFLVKYEFFKNRLMGWVSE